MKSDAVHLCLRHDVVLADCDVVRRLAASTGFFRPDEINVAVELVEERLRRGDASGYYFIFAQSSSRTVGYACYGPIPCTVGSFDLYWIVVEPNQQRQGVGRMLLRETERLIRQLSGRNLYIETSNRAQYASTREFYRRCGFAVAAILDDFYDVGDDKVVYLKVLNEELA